MTEDEVLNYFQENYPGKNIIMIPDGNPSEIICEVDPSSEHPKFNRAVAAIKESEPHYHKYAVEKYKVIIGELKLNVDGQVIKLKEGDEYTIEPGKMHSAEGNFTIVQVDSEPGWNKDDHFLV